MKTRIMALTDDQKREFDENGYIIVRNLLIREEVEAVGARRPDRHGRDRTVGVCRPSRTGNSTQ